MITANDTCISLQNEHPLASHNFLKLLKKRNLKSIRFTEITLSLFGMYKLS